MNNVLIDSECSICKERSAIVRFVPGGRHLYACLSCVPVGRERTAVLRQNIKHLRQESSAHYARYTAVGVEMSRLQCELEALEGNGCESVRLKFSNEGGLGGEVVCGQATVAVLDAGTSRAQRLCFECAAAAHSSRLTWLVLAEDVAATAVGAGGDR